MCLFELDRDTLHTRLGSAHECHSGVRLCAFAATGFGCCAFRGSGSRQGRRELEPYPTDRARGTLLQLCIVAEVDRHCGIVRDFLRDLSRWSRLAALTEVTRQQGELLQRLCERIAQPPSSAPRVPESPVPPLTTPVTASAAAVPPSAAVSVAPVAPARGPVPLTEAEQERWTERLARFRRFDPPIFDGSGTDAWVVEGWVSAMERLFEDLFVPEGEQVPLGVHCLSGDARDWWRRARRDQGLVAAQLRWDEFCGMLYGMYFPTA
uniref:Retrotransposon gag domain-containing protein n=1 Tax=Ananas comosus var. bracteatus TaxID=296719 RepID=A0A6V7QBF8_ANACO|nr:unnamed protein product [Ananas comosus var. bracteatus]